MTTLLHSQLLDLLVAALGIPPAVASGNIKRHHTRPLASGVAQMVNVRLVRSVASAAMLGGEAPIEWRTLVGVECIARASASQSADEAVATLVGEVHARITASSALLSAGYRVYPDHQLEWDQDDLDERIGAVTVVYTVRHFGAINSITTAA